MVAMPPPPPPPPPFPPPPPEAVTVENGGPLEAAEPKSPSCFLHFINTITHLLLGSVAACGIMLGNHLGHIGVPGWGPLRQHIYLCIIGYVILMSQAILVFSPATGWSISMKYQDKRVVHWVMQVIGSILAIVGSIIKIVDTADGNQFQTTHGIMGLIAMLLTFLSLIGGLLNLFCSAQAQQAVYKIMHSCFGTLTLTIAFITLCLGFDNELYRAILGDINANLAITLSVSALCGTLVSTIMNNLKRLGCC